MERGHKLIWWMMGLLGSLFVAGALAYANTIQTNIAETQKSVALRNERIAVLESTINSMSYRLERMENKLDSIQRKVSQ